MFNGSPRNIKKCKKLIYLLLKKLSNYFNYKIDKMNYIKELCGYNQVDIQKKINIDRDLVDYLKRLGYPLLFIIKNQNPEICKEAIKQKHYTLHAIKHIKNKNYNLYLEAVKQNGMALQFVDIQDNTLYQYLCLEAVKQNGLALQFIEKQTYEICLEAVKQNGLALQFIEKQTYEICLEAVKQNGLALQYVANNIINQNTDNIIAFAYNNKYFIIETDTNLHDLAPCLICLLIGNITWCKIIKCNHKFHTNCLIKWMKEKKNCPCCRVNL